jgi:hypothetical protein
LENELEEFARASLLSELTLLSKTKPVGRK